MEAQPGPRKKNHGKTVYSQTANAIRLRKLKGLGEFADAAAAADTPPITTEAPPESVSAPGGLSTEAIGVVTTVAVPEPVAAPEDEDDTYFCQNCHKKPIKKGTPECPTCEEPLNWSGLT